MASRISFKQLGIDDIRPYIGGQVFIKSTEITNWKQDITINTSVVKLKNGNALSKLHEENLKLIQVVDSNDNIVGIAIVKQYNATTSQFTINALEYGTGKGKFSIYKSLKDLNKTIDGSTFLVFSDIVTSGITINDLDENQLVYDKDGTVARISTIDVSTNSFTVITMTTSGKQFMPIAPDTKELKLKNGGSGYSIGDIVESTTSGVFAEVIDVDANGIILDIQNTTSTTQSTSGTGAIIDYDQVIYGGYGDNWAALSDTAVLVAQALAEKFDYETGYDFTISNAGSGYVIGDVIATDVSNINVKVTSIGTSGEIQGVEYTRNTINTSGTGASVTATPNSNIFIIPSQHWNNGTALFSLVNDEGAQVEFYRTGDILKKYNAGADGKVYKFTFNEVNGTIKQEAVKISGGDSKLIRNVKANVSAGAISSGDTVLKDTTFTEFVEKLLIKEVAPAISFTSSQSGVLEVGTTVTNPTLRLQINSLGTGTPTNINFYVGSTLVDTQPYVPGTNVYTYSYVGTITSTSSTKVTLDYNKSDNTPATLTATKSYIFVYASYYGPISMATPTDTDVKALTKNVKNTKAFTYNNITLNDERICYAYPVSFGNLTSIKDANNFEYISSYTKYTMTIDSVSYNVYVLTDPITATGFKQIYS